MPAHPVIIKDAVVFDGERLHCRCSKCQATFLDVAVMLRPKNVQDVGIAVVTQQQRAMTSVERLQRLKELNRGRIVLECFGNIDWSRFEETLEELRQLKIHYDDNGDTESAEATGQAVIFLEVFHGVAESTGFCLE